MANESSSQPQVAWAENLKHREQPNVVPDLPVPSLGQFEPQPPATRDIPTSVATADTRPPEPALAPQVEGRQREPSYYDLSMLKAPVWKWQIAGYFFFGGLSAGAYVLARVAERAGGERYRELTRLGTYVAMASFIPCPPLLIHDLGDPKRFHHMLRIWKPSSPMNLGTWTIVAYSGMATAAVTREFVRHNAPRIEKALLSKGSGPILLALHDAAGVPFALLVAGYTGVLLNSTSNPLWCKNTWLGPLFTASAIATGAEAISLALDCCSDQDNSDAQAALKTIDTVAHAAEVACLSGFQRAAGEKARPLTRGSMKTHMQLSKGCLYAAEVLKWLPLRGRAGRAARMAAMGLGLVSGFAMRWAMVHGGAEAANDPHLARLNSGNQRLPERSR